MSNSCKETLRICMNTEKVNSIPFKKPTILKISQLSSWQAFRILTVDVITHIKHFIFGRLFFEEHIFLKDTSLCLTHLIFNNFIFTLNNLFQDNNCLQKTSGWNLHTSLPKDTFLLTCVVMLYLHYIYSSSKKLELCFSSLLWYSSLIHFN